MRRRALLITAAAIAGASVIGSAWLLGHAPGAPVASISATAPTASPTPTPTITPTPTPTAIPGEVAASAPSRLEVPGLGIDAVVLTVSPDAGVIDPPTMTEVYWIVDYGAPGTDATNTVYLVGHSSLTVADAVFNPLLDVASQECLLAPGDELLLTTINGVLEYEVTGCRRIPKRDLPASSIWNVEPGVLHLITCFQEEGTVGRAADNLVVTARIVAGYQRPGDESPVTG